MLLDEGEGDEEDEDDVDEEALESDADIGTVLTRIGRTCRAVATDGKIVVVDAAGAADDEDCAGVAGCDADDGVAPKRNVRVASKRFTNASYTSPMMAF